MKEKLSLILESKVGEKVGFYLLIIYFLILSYHFYAFAIKKPIINWDILPYVAIAKSYEIKDFQNVRASTLAEFKHFLSLKQYRSLMSGNNYRKKFSQDQNVFEQQLGFYKIRILYTLLIYFLSKIGMNIVKATYFVSILSVIFALWLLFFSFYRYVFLSFWFVFPLFCYALDISILARLSTPDALAFLGISFVILLFIKGHFSFLSMFLPVLVFIRTDLLIFCVLFALFAFLMGYPRRLFLLVSVFLSLLCYFLLIKYCHYYGWKTVIYHTFVKRTLLPASENIYFPFDWYFLRLRAIFLAPLKGSPSVSLYFVLVSLSLSLVVFLWRVKKVKEEYCKLFILNLSTLFYCILHVILFPAVWSRFFVGFYLLVILSVLFVLTEFSSLVFAKNNEKF